MKPRPPAAPRATAPYSAPMLIEALGSVQDLSRINQISGVLVRHDLGDMVRRLGLADMLARAGHILRREHATILDARGVYRPLSLSK